MVHRSANLKLLYITGLNIKYYASFGILKKILGQVNAFITLNYDVDLCFFVDNDYLLFSTNSEKFYSSKGSRSSSILNTLKGMSALCHLSKEIEQRNYDIVYIRFVSLNINTLLFLKSIKKHTKFIILEIPTFPYMKEKYARTNKKNYFAFIRFLKCCFMDYSIRKLLRRYISFIVLTIPKKSLWRIPVVSIENGIDLQKIGPRNKPVANNKIVFFTATNIENWQGLDRLIYGLSIYYQQNKDDAKEVIIKIAGEGSEKNRLERLVKKLRLEKNVQFFGQKSGKYLDKLYDEADIAIGSLGRHRQKTNMVSTLKVKEYCAKGIPFIYSNDEPALTGREGFALKVPADDSPIDFCEVIDFFKRVHNSQADIIEMKDLAKRKFDWIHQIGLVHNQIQIQNP